MAQKATIQKLVVKQLGRKQGAAYHHFHHTCDTHSRHTVCQEMTLGGKMHEWSHVLEYKTLRPLQSLRKVFLRHTELNGDIWDSLQALRADQGLPSPISTCFLSPTPWALHGSRSASFLLVEGQDSVVKGLCQIMATDDFHSQRIPEGPLKTEALNC